MNSPSSAFLRRTPATAGAKSISDLYHRVPKLLVIEPQKAMPARRDGDHPYPHCSCAIVCGCSLMEVRFTVQMAAPQSSKHGCSLIDVGPSDLAFRELCELKISPLISRRETLRSDFGIVHHGLCLCSGDSPLIMSSPEMHSALYSTVFHAHPGSAFTSQLSPSTLTLYSRHA